MLKILVPFLSGEQSRDALEAQQDWFSLYDRLSRDKSYNDEELIKLFIKDIWKSLVPTDIKLKLIQDAQYAGFTKRAIELSLCTVLGMEILGESELLVEKLTFYRRSNRKHTPIHFLGFEDIKRSDI